jgi:putative Mn2+ efflux pump MntP
MLMDGLHPETEGDSAPAVGLASLAVQGVATSIDALSVGFTISGHSPVQALVACLLIAAVTFVICYGGVAIGRKFGKHLSGKASVLGGVILIFIGIEIFVSGVFL